MKGRRSLLICLAILGLVFLACNGAEEATQGSVAVRTPAMGTVVLPPEEATPTAEPPSTQAPTVPEVPALTVSGGYTYVSGSYFHLVGQVENNTDDWLEAVKIVATYYDQAGVMVGTDFGYTDLAQVPPRGVGVFSLGVDTSELSGEVATYELQAQARRGDPTPCEGLNVSVFNEYQERSWYFLEGLVENEGPADCESVKIVAGFYDESGGVVGVDYGYAEMDVVPAGGQSPFHLGTDDVPGYDHFQVWVQGRPLP